MPAKNPIASSRADSLLTIREAATHTRLSSAQLRAAVVRGELMPTRILNSLYIHPGDLEDYLLQHPSARRPA
jgi:hypothetical protein